MDNFYEHVDSELLAHPLSVPIILLLNKVDLFRKSLLENPAKFHQSFNDEKHKSPEESQADYEDRCIRAVRKVVPLFFAAFRSPRVCALLTLPIVPAEI